MNTLCKIVGAHLRARAVSRSRPTATTWNPSSPASNPIPSSRWIRRSDINSPCSTSRPACPNFALPLQPRLWTCVNAGIRFCGNRDGPRCTLGVPKPGSPTRWPPRGRFPGGFPCLSLLFTLLFLLFLCIAVDHNRSDGKPCLCRARRHQLQIMLLDNRRGISRLIGHLGHVFVDGNERRNASMPQRVLLPLDASVLGDLLLEPVKEAVAASPRPVDEAGCVD